MCLTWADKMYEALEGWTDKKGHLVAGLSAYFVKKEVRQARAK